MEKLQDRLLSPQVLALPYADGLCTLDTDRCSVKVGCALLQEQQDEITKLVGF